MTSTQQRARFAGFLYLLIALSGPIGLVYVPGQIIVPGDAGATAEHLRASESLLRIGIASELFHQVVQIFLVLALYELFRPVSERLAKQVVILGALVSVPIVFVDVLNELAALSFAGNADFLASFDRAQRDALAYVFLDLHGEGVVVVSLFWGLWLFPFGILVVRCGFIPRFLGALLVVAGVGYVVSCLVTLTLPTYAPLVSQIALPLEMGEVPIVFWLLIWGVRQTPG